MRLTRQAPEHLSKAASGALYAQRRIGPDDHGIGYGNDLGDGEIGP